MPKEGHIGMEDLQVKFGYSTAPSSLHFYREDENEFREKIREFAENEIDPVVDEVEREADYSLIKDLMRKMGKDGILKVSFPEKYGGEGKGVVYRTIVAEEFAARSLAIDISRMASVDLFGFPVLTFGTEEQILKFLLPVVKGEKIGAIGITEPTGGCDAVGGMRTRAKKVGKEYIISGEKRFITNGSAADFILLYAITDPSLPPRKGMSAFIFPTDTDGFQVVKDYELMGRRGAINSHLRFQDCRIPEENLLGKENGGFSILMHGLQ